MSQTPDAVKADHTDYGTNQDIYFKLHDVYAGQTIAALELPHDVSFLQDLVNENMTFTVKGSERLTIVPCDDLARESMMMLYESLLSLDEPTRFSHILQQRQDGLVNQVQSTFGTQERVVITGAEDMVSYLKFLRGMAKEYKPKVVKRRKLGALVSFIDELAAQVKKKGCGCGAAECHAEMED